jgi:non-specific serine/threonine protein kinase
MSTALAPALTPSGRLHLAPADDAVPLAPEVAARVAAAFARGSGHGLLQLGAAEVQTVLPPVFGYWRDLGARFVTLVCGLPDVEELRGRAEVPALAEADAEALAQAAPPMVGGEYVTAGLLVALWGELDRAFRAELAEHQGTVQEYLARQHPAWHLVGRVHFNLAENRKDEAAPFAFMATYTTRLSAHGKAQHVPLGQALKEYAGAANKQRLLSLLLPVQRAADLCPWLRAMVDTAGIFHPLRWSPAEAVRLLRDLPKLEAAGVVVRVPAQWRARRPPRPQVTATVGGAAPVGLGTDALLDFELSVTLEGERLTEKEIRQLLASTDGLALVRGQWVEVDRDRLQRMLEEMRAAQAAAKAEGLTFAEALRFLAGARVTDEDDAERLDADWAHVTAGPWLAQTLACLRGPEGLSRVDPGPALQATLRPYQQAGLQWLHLLASLGLGACLADDMGLGKTLQALALLLALKQRGKVSSADAAAKPSLLVAPASLLANWGMEIERFAPSLRAFVAHPSVTPAAELKAPNASAVEKVDLVITSYGTLLRLPWLTEWRWRLAILDEAQAIKNPGAKQTRAAKRLAADARVVLTGTPVENRLGDLWSIFDFLNPGLLGSSKEFGGFAKRLAARPHNPYAPLRDLVRPYILRRLKTDKTVIADLPDKTEVKAYCPLARKQAALYQQAVKDLAEQLRAVDGMKRRGIVLAFLMRLKQICNHPSQWLGDGAWAPGDSGKLGRLREIAETVAARQEKVLVFTQFREITAPLAAFLGEVFGRPGLVLHGETAVGKRQGLVRQFQEDESVPFFVLSLKAGGSGLNLTAASHVVHFDRWWNPAVENQATDRAFRIGQTKNVLVHKFVCRGTVEDKIDQLIESKRQLSRDLLEGGAELLLTEMKDDELLKLVALDLRASAEEN